jgi:hypothetical protein
MLNHIIFYKLFLFQILGNINLDGMSPKKLRKRYICSEHFDNSMYMNSSSEKPRLIHNAIPKKYSRGEKFKL